MTKIPHPLQSSAIARPEHLAIVSEGQELTYRRLRDRVAQTASRLEGMGILPGDRVGLVGTINADWMVSCLAIGWIGAVVAPVNQKAPPREQRRVLDLMGAKIVLTDVQAAETIAEADPKIQPVIEEPMFALKAERPWDLNETRVLMATSGSTAQPKVIALSTEQIFYSAMGSAIRLGHSLDDRWLLCLPPHHIGGLSILFRCVWFGTTIVLEPRFSPDRINDLIDRGEATQVSLTPNMLKALLVARDDTPFPDTLRLILLGGSAADSALLERCRDFPTHVVCTWGMTETASQAATTVPGDDPSLPMPPMPFARITDHDGHLTIRGPIAGRNTFESKDLGHVDEQGRVSIRGRGDRCITSGGAQIDLAEIEEVARRYPGVCKAVALGLKDEKWGQRPAVVLVPLPGAPLLDVDAFLAWSREEMSGYKVPDHVVVTDALPTNDMGKIQHSELYALFEQADTTKRLGELRGQPDLLESVDGDEGVHQTDPGAQTTVADAKDLVTEGDGIRTHSLHADHNTQSLSHPHGVGEIGFGVHEGHAPTATLEDPLEGLVTSPEHLFEDVVTILEGTTEEGDTGTINVMKTDGDLVLKSHKNNSLEPTGKTP